MADYYRRQFEFSLGDDPNALEVFIEATNERQFRVVFNVLIDFSNFMSYADIAIYGLARGTESKVFKRFTNVALRAGYENNIDFIFRGQIQNVLRERAGPDRITRVIARGGAQPLTEASIARSLGAGSVLLDILKACSASLGFPLVIDGDDFQQRYARGYSMNGDPKTVLNDLAKSWDFNWIIENNRVVIVSGKSHRGSNIHQISALTGMVASPEITGGGDVETGVDVAVRMNPALKVGERFQVKSEYPRANFSNVYFSNIPKTLGEGIYKIVRLEHAGDSFGDEWDTRISGLKWGLV